MPVILTTLDATMKTTKIPACALCQSLIFEGSGLTPRPLKLVLSAEQTGGDPIAGELTICDACYTMLQDDNAHLGRDFVIYLEQDDLGNLCVKFGNNA